MPYRPPHGGVAGECKIIGDIALTQASFGSCCNHQAERRPELAFCKCCGRICAFTFVPPGVFYLYSLTSMMRTLPMGAIGDKSLLLNRITLSPMAMRIVLSKRSTASVGRVTQQPLSLL